MSIARQTLSPTTTTAAGAGLGGFRPGSGTLLAVLLCLVVAAPLLALLGFIGQPT
jgi:hypothetical protein